MQKVGAVGLALVLIVAAWIAGATARTSSAQDEQPGEAVQWEYTWASGHVNDRFNQLGAEGWELCVAVKENDQTSPVFIFKRPKR